MSPLFLYVLTHALTIVSGARSGAGLVERTGARSGARAVWRERALGTGPSSDAVEAA